MKAKIIGLASLISLLIASCASYDDRSFSGLKTEQAFSRLGSAVYIANSCPSIVKEGREEEPVTAVLLSAAIAIGVEFAINATGKYLAEKKEGLNGFFFSVGTTEKQQIKASGQCLIIARGLFGDVGKDYVENGIFTKQLLSSLSLADYPAFYLELSVDQSKDLNSITLNPVYLSDAASSARTEGSGRKNVSVAIAMSESVQKATSSAALDEEKAFAVFRHNFGLIEIGKSYAGKALTGTAASQTSDKFKKSPFNITALVTESEDPNIALAAFSEAFKNKKSDLQSALEKTLKNAIGNNDSENK